MDFTPKSAVLRRGRQCTTLAERFGLAGNVSRRYAPSQVYKPLLIRVVQVPIQTSLCNWSLMSRAEIQWLNDHNTSVQDNLMPLMDGDEDKEARDWVKRMCKPKKIWPWTGV